MKGLELDGDFEAQRGGVPAQLAKAFYRPIPLIAGRNDLLLPDIFADYYKVVLRFELIAQIQVFFGTVDVEAANGGVEVGYAEGAADDGDDGEAGFADGVADEAALLDGRVQG